MTMLNEIIQRAEDEFDEEFVGNKVGRIYSWKSTALTDCTSVRKFLSTQIRQAVEQVKEKLTLEYANLPIEESEQELGYNQAVHDLEHLKEQI